MSVGPGPWERLMGLDYGDKRIGIAYASLLSVGSAMVVPAGFLEQNSSTEESVEELVDMVEEEGVDGVVLGIPLKGGEETPQTRKVLAFAKLLKAALPESVPLYGWDESYSSASAQSQLVEAELKHSGKRHRGRVDAAAAALILQGFVDAHQNRVGAVGMIF